MLGWSVETATQVILFLCSLLDCLTQCYVDGFVHVGWILKTALVITCGMQELLALCVLQRVCDSWSQDLHLPAVHYLLHYPYLSQRSLMYHFLSQETEMKLTMFNRDYLKSKGQCCQ